MIQQPNRPCPAADASKPNRLFPELVATQRDTLLVTYAIPVERACEMLPRGMAPDILPIVAPDGQTHIVAFAQCLYGRMDGVRPTARWGGLASVNTLRLTLRLLVRQEQGTGAFLLRQFISDRTSSASIAPLRLLVSAVERARITAHITGNPMLPLCDTCHIEALTPTLRFTLSATVAAPQNGDGSSSSLNLHNYRDLDAFFTRREHLYSLARQNDRLVHIKQTSLSDLPALSENDNVQASEATESQPDPERDTEDMNAAPNESQAAKFLPLHLTHARLPLFAHWFALTDEELQSPVAVHWQSAEAVRLSVSRLHKLR